MFQYARNMEINGGAFTVNEQNGMTGLQLLHRCVSDGAAHDSVQHAPVCHPDTRKTILGDIMSWIEDPSRTSSVLWFNGPAGAGKTAIAQSLCKRCAAAQWLAGSFFFSRQGRNNADFLFPTISFGLSLAIPDVGKIIDRAVANDPSIPTKALEIQLQKLILEPLQQVSEQSNQPIVIIIDGLDECEGEDMQCNVLRLLGSAFQQLSVGGCDRICFIVTSRPEPWIHDEFSIEPLSSVTRQIFLGQTPEANDDIWTFFQLGFTEIHDSPKHRLTMSNVAKPWPSYRVLDDLVDKASGQFIYPSTVLKFVGDPNYRPTDRLDIIASMPIISPSALALKPLASLDQLYSQILSTSSDIPRTLDILSALIAMQPINFGMFQTWTPDTADLLRIAERLLGLQPGDGVQALRKIHSLVHITGRSLMSDVADDNLLVPMRHRDGRYEDEIRFHHKSFVDYLLDPSRSLEYCVDMEEMNTRLALACIVTMQTFSLQPTSRIACYVWGYSTLRWTYHVSASGTPQRTLLQTLMSFDLFACYLDTLGPQIESECRHTIKRLAFPSKPAIRTLTLLRPKMDVIDKTCPNSTDIEVAREFLLNKSGTAQYDFVVFRCGKGIEEVVNWMKKNPDSPRKLIKQYQVVANILSYYSNSERHRGPIPNFFENVHNRFSIVDCWANVKKFLT